MSRTVAPTPRRGVALAVGLLLSAGVAGCSDASVAEAAGPGADCLEVSDDVLAQIAVGTRAGKAFEPEAGSAVEARSGVYVVAVRFRGDRDDPQVGNWTVTALDGVVAPVLVADQVSSAYTTWSTVEEFPQYGIALTSPLISAVRDCLGG